MGPGKLLGSLIRMDAPYQSVIFRWIPPAPWTRGKRKRNGRRKHRHSKKTGSPDLKVTTRGEGADSPVWTRAGSTKDSSSSSDSQSNSGVGSNPSFQPFRDTDTEPGQGTVVTPLLSPDPTREPPDDDPLSD